MESKKGSSNVQGKLVKRRLQWGRIDYRIREDTLIQSRELKPDSWDLSNSSAIAKNL